MTLNIYITRPSMNNKYRLSLLTSEEPIFKEVIMDYNKIESFISIVETGSITGAAEKLFISQSTLSDRLTALEEELDTRLIHRGPGNKKIELTEKGVDFLDFAARYIDLNKEIEEWKQNRQRTHLKISAPQSVNSHLFHRFYKKYLESDQDHLDISSHWNRTIYNMVYSFETDIGIVSRPYQSKQIITEPLLEEPLMVVYDQRYADYDDLKQLDKKNQIYMGWGPAYEEWYHQHWDPNESPKITLDSPKLLMSYLESADAWAIVPLCLYNEITNENQHIKEVEENLPIKRILYIIYQRGVSKARNKMTENFIRDLYHYILEMETSGLCKVLMDEPNINND